MNQPLGAIRPEDFRRIREIFESASACSPADRARFVETACDGDIQLMHEVRKMLDADEMSHPLLDRECQDRPSLREGQVYANHFEIAGILGRGGMGEVYLGRDTTLNREVAIKVLPSAFTRDPERLARFRREAQVLASLNHPGIGAIYSFEESDGIQALALEYVQGPTLAERIAHGPIAREEALSIARQIAEALEAAHDQGIVHRDLKPANVKLRPDGVVKVLDFGLAKALQPAERALESGSGSPGLTSPVLIALGVTMGTPAYMSPEQAKGRMVDRRTDIWAFGAVLYEMLSGQRAFSGADAPETLASVLQQGINWAAIPASTPAPLRRLIERCLERDPRQRLRDIGEARILLSSPASQPETSPAVAVQGGKWKGRVAHWLLIAAAIGGIAGVGILYLSRRNRQPNDVVRLAMVLSEGQPLFANRSMMAISPNGRQIVYARPSGLHLRQLSESEAKIIPGTEGFFNLTEPAFSPDGRQIAFHTGSDRTLRRVPVTGGTAVIICGARAPAGVTWSKEGLLYTDATAFPPGPSLEDLEVSVFLVSPDGGTPKQMVHLKKGELAQRAQFLPGGRSVLFTLVTGGGADRWQKARIVAQDLVSGERTLILQGGTDARYVSTGHLVYAVGGSLFGIAFDPRRLRTEGGAVPIVEGVMRSEPESPGAAHFAFSENGTLAFVPGPMSPGWDLAIADSKGRIEPLHLPSRVYEAPRVSPDGTQVAFESVDDNEASIHIYNLSGRSATRRFTFGGNNRLPVWSSDGKHIAFQSDRERDRAIFRQRADGTTAAERLTKPEAGETHEPESWSPLGHFLLFSVRKGTDISLWTLELKSRKTAPYGDVHSSLPLSATFRPDGKWVAYAQSEGEPKPWPDRKKIYVQPFPATGIRHELPREGIENPNHPAWALDGKTLFFNPGPSLFKSVSVTTTPAFAFGNSVSLPRIFRAAHPLKPRPYDVAPDGRFVAAIERGQYVSGRPVAPQIQVVLNWFEDLRARVPNDR
jgi:eukaryotic-like serine/threonine-protein kinase